MTIIKGVVSFNMTKNNGDVNEINISITPEDTKAVAEIVNSKIDNPLKTSENGEIYFKSHSKFDVVVYDNGEKSEEIIPGEIGVGSTVELAVNIKEGKYKGKPYQSAYLKAINVLEFVPAEEYNPFTSK